MPTISSHGNSKDKKPFFPTWPSTCDLIKSHCSKGPKATLHQVSSEVGGLTDSAAPGELPRSEKQVTRIRSKEKSSILQIIMVLMSFLLSCSELIYRIHHLNLCVE